MNRLTLLDGPVGTELARRGLDLRLPLWSAAVLDEAPELLSDIHRDYAAAGATVHTANTFRTDGWSLRKVGLEQRWEDLTGRAVELARAAVPPEHRVAGSLSPLEDCYRPDLSPAPAVCLREHRRTARLLADAGVDLLLCETFPHPGEALAALEASLETGLPVWLSMTQGPFGELLASSRLLQALADAASRGAAAVLVNCSSVEVVRPLLEGLAAVQVPFGVYGNVGEPDDVTGWRNDGDARPGPYAEAARAWIEAGATIVGGCCGTTPAHIAALAELAPGGSPVE